MVYNGLIYSDEEKSFQKIDTRVDLIQLFGANWLTSFETFHIQVKILVKLMQRLNLQKSLSNFTLKKFYEIGPIGA